MSVYRVAGLPAKVSGAIARQILDDFFGLEAKTVIRSLGLHPQRHSLVAIVMFSHVPGSLSASARKHWMIEKVVRYGGELRNVQLEVDTDFLGFTPLNNLEDVTDRKIDCIVVSGLSSHPFGSWKDRGGQFMWLVDDVGCIPSNVRLLLYGYDTSLLASRSFQGVADIGERLSNSIRSIRAHPSIEPRPLVFISHSLGGLVVKETICHMAKVDPANVMCIYCYTYCYRLRP
ncbi:hypothetical protein F5Y08DRAFT_142949 [Xylaria arbuscula]|nr:hypothetical protein F5Y08DRAFT_142949 [Xylaria arbuscula]